MLENTDGSFLRQFWQQLRHESYHLTLPTEQNRWANGA